MPFARRPGACGMKEELISAMREYMDFEIRELRSALDEIFLDREAHARVVITNVLARLLTEKARLENQLKDQPAIVEADDAGGQRNRMTVEQQGESHEN